MQKYGLLFIMLMAGMMLSMAPAGAEPPPIGKEESKNPSWSGEIETGLAYDGNVFQEKEGAESDIIWESSLYLAYRPGQIRWSGLATFNRYLDNSELSYEFYELGAERPFGEKNHGNLFLQLSPPAPLDKEDPSFPLITLGSYGFTARFDRDLSPWWNTGLSFSYDRLNYSDAFDAKDTDVVKIGFPQTFRLKTGWRFLVDYSFEEGFARGGTVPSGRPDDISYVAHAAAFQAGYQWAAPVSIRLRYRIRSKTFNTDLPKETEPIHSGRSDTSHALLAGLRYQPFPNVVVRARSQLLWRNSSDPFVEFNEWIHGLSVSYLF